MKKIFTASISLLITVVVTADSPGIAYQYDQYSQNGKYYYNSIPFYWLDLTDFGKTTVYDTKTNKPMYRIENYMPVGSFMSNNGETIFSLIDWIGQFQPEKENVLDVYIKGKKVKSYHIDNFTNEKLTITYTTSHAFWYKNIFMNNDTLFIHTLDEQVILLDGNSGKVLRISDEELVTQRFDMKSLPLAKKVIYDTIKYPNRYMFPDLKSGISFKQSLLKYLGGKDVENTDDSPKYSVSIATVIDRIGNTAIYYSSASDKQGKEDKILENKVRTWVKKQKFKTNLIPINADKWVFEEYLYFL